MNDGFTKTPITIQNPIPPEVTKHIREAISSKHGWYIVIHRTDEAGIVHRYERRSDSFDWNQMKTAYDMLVGRFLEVERPKEIEEAHQPKEPLDSGVECEETRKARQTQDNG